MMLVASVPVSAPALQPTHVVRLAGLFPYTQRLALGAASPGPSAACPPSCSASWLALAQRTSGRPRHSGVLTELLPAVLLGLPRLPTPRTLSISLADFLAQGLRATVEAGYRAELPHRSGRIWPALDACRFPYWGRGKTA